MSYWQRWGLGIAILGLGMSIKFPAAEWWASGSPLVLVGTIALIFFPSDNSSEIPNSSPEHVSKQDRSPEDV